MENKEILKQLKLTASLLELHTVPGKNDNTFKIRSYNNAIFNLERQDNHLAELSFEEICKIDGVGKSIAANIVELIQSGHFPLLDDLIQSTPPGIIEMLQLKGIGPKKIRVIWEELKIETLVDLLKACEEGKISKLKGFGDKTEETIKNALLFVTRSKNKLLFITAEAIALQLEQKIKTIFPEALLSAAGELRRKLEIIEKIEFVLGFDDILKAHEGLDRIELIEQDRKKSGPFAWRGKLIDGSLEVVIILTKKENFYNQLVLHTGSEKHLAYALPDQKSLIKISSQQKFVSEEEAYQLAGLPYIEPELREGTFEFTLAAENKLPKLVEMEDLKGVIHSHSTYSDGKNTLEEMAEFCMSSGYEYLGISDHSKAAFYANGLEEFRIIKQHQEIDQLNEKLSPFRIFKGIESDILNDGSLDYENDVLSSFDFVIASIHSNLKMDIKKATDRLIKAVSNPFTTILGHATGRLLLRREGYPIDHKEVIDACAQNGVIIEINANPNRLDMDWRWIHYALEQNVLISINPDAHEKESYAKMYYGICVARKAGLSKDRTFNALSAKEVDDYFKKRKESIKI